MAISTITFSKFASAGDIKNDSITVGLDSGTNAKFNNPWTFLPPGTTAARPTPSSDMYYRLRFNTTDQLYEYYDPLLAEWVILDDSGSVAEVLALLASHLVDEGASLIGLQDQSGVVSKTVQDLANSTIITQVNNGTLVNGFALSSLSTGFVTVTTSTGALVSRTLTGTSNQIAVTNGTEGGNPVFSLPSALILPGTLKLGGDLDVNNFDFINSQTNGGFSFNTTGAGVWELNSTQGIIGVSNDPTFSADSAELVPTQAAVKAYVATIASGFIPVGGGPCVCSTTDNLNATYANGAAGVGATLTMNVVGVFTADGVTPTINQRVLVPFQTATADNGIYTITTLGDGSTAAILTRATDYDTAAEIRPGTIVAVKPPPSGTNTYGGSVWVQTDTVVTVGTDPIEFQLFAQPSNTFVTLATSQQITGAKTFADSTLLLKGSTSGATTLHASAIAGSTALTFPATTDTVVTNAYSATLTNKTLDFDNNTILNIPVSALADNTAGALVSWDGGGNVTTIVPGTVGLPLISSGTGNLSTYSQLPVASVADATAGSLFAWDASGNATTISPGTEDYVLTSNGVGALPTWQASTSGSSTAPTQQIFTSGSGTYTTPGGVSYIKIQVVGGGGGGGGGGVSTAGTGGTGGTSSFGGGIISCTGGNGGSFGAYGGTYGFGSLSSPAYGAAFNGSYGDPGTFINTNSVSDSFTASGGNGGASFFGGQGGGGPNGFAGQAGAANTGAGGGGGGRAGTTLAASSGGGGGSGGYVEAYIDSPSSSYAYTVGSGGSGGANTSYGGVGGTGAAGIIIVTEYY